ncbi:hypothetical protein [Streptomyces sp. bgisy100]|uniref:hypothetical protein n=1 Tax=Streptomyces sp. bgisy100 TaxID=3413783 RepID=UPI003D70BA15
MNATASSQERGERTLFEEALHGPLHGTGPDVAEAQEKLLARTAADEMMVTTSTYDRRRELDSYRRLARVVGLPGGAGAGRPATAPPRAPAETDEHPGP